MALNELLRLLELHNLFACANQFSELLRFFHNVFANNQIAGIILWHSAIRMIVVLMLFSQGFTPSICIPLLAQIRCYP
ncbi:hypothetical protein D3C74_478020 [compost metagenome]